MKATILNGFLVEGETTQSVRKIIESELAGKRWLVDSFVLRDMKIASCLGCFNCWLKTPGICVIDDAGRDVTKAYVQSDVTFFLTHVTFGGYSSELKKAVDRLIPCISPYFIKIHGETHHRPRYEKYPKLVVIGVLRHADVESERIFKTLVGRNAINMHSPAHTTCIVSERDWSDEIRNKIGESLDKVGVLQ